MSGTFRVPSDQEGRRLDRLLRLLWPAVPLGAIMKALRMGEVRLDGKKARPDERVARGQEIFYTWDESPGRLRNEKEKSERDVPGVTKLRVLYRDDTIWVVDKPAGLLTQPDRSRHPSVVDRVAAELAWTRRDFYPVCVHRLDRNTSGCVLVALDPRSARSYAALFAERKISKTYLAVVRGKTECEGEVALPLRKDPMTNEVFVAADSHEGKPSLTRYHAFDRNDGASLLELELVTGRAHQARVHLAAIGHPILGDRKYGDSCERREKEEKNIPRQMLHAWKLALPGRCIVAAIPEDMERVLRHYALTFVPKGEEANCSKVL